MAAPGLIKEYLVLLKSPLSDLLYPSRNMQDVTLQQW